MIAALRGMALACGVAAAASAWAGRGHEAPAIPYLPEYTRECGSCHVAYPPGMLGAASWQRLMAGLARHFGTDAALDDAQAKAISSWLRTNAGTYRRLDPQPAGDRITRSAWWIREHDEVAPGVWKRAAVRSPSNCSACHPRAAQGAFDEHDIRTPR